MTQAEAIRKALQAHVIALEAVHKRLMRISLTPSKAMSQPRPVSSTDRFFGTRATF